MGKKALDVPAIKKAIEEGRDNGKTDQEIYNELVPLFYDKRTLALIITGNPTKENIEKYKVYNNILLGILALSIVFKFLTVFNLAMSFGQPLLLLLIFVVPLFTAYFIYEIRRYSAFAYRACGLLAIAGFLQSIRNTSDAADVLINLVFAGSVCFLSFYLDKKLFPKYSPGKLQKDANGEFILN